LRFERETVTACFHYISFNRAKSLDSSDSDVGEGKHAGAGNQEDAESDIEPPTPPLRQQVVKHKRARHLGRRLASSRDDTHAGVSYQEDDDSEIAPPTPPLHEQVVQHKKARLMGRHPSSPALSSDRGPSSSTCPGLDNDLATVRSSFFYFFVAVKDEIANMFGCDFQIGRTLEGFV
jgi:hypothetical protein